MFDFHEKRKLRRILYSRTAIIVVFLLALLLSRSAYERFKVERDMATRLLERTNEYEELKSRAALLESKVSHLENERGIEEEIRSRFDVAKEGEQVVVIIDDSKEAVVDKDEGTVSGSEEKSLFERIEAWFGW